MRSSLLRRCWPAYDLGFQPFYALARGESAFFEAMDRRSMMVSSDLIPCGYAGPDQPPSFEKMTRNAGELSCGRPSSNQPNDLGRRKKIAVCVLFHGSPWLVVRRGLSVVGNQGKEPQEHCVERFFVFFLICGQSPGANRGSTHRNQVRAGREEEEKKTLTQADGEGVFGGPTFPPKDAIAKRADLPQARIYTCPQTLV